MGSRKDIIKRNLGITEYPWSSDDDLEEAPVAAEESGHRRPPGEARIGTADVPGSSGVPQQQLPVPQPQQMDALPQHLPPQQQPSYQQQQQLHQQQQQQLQQQQQQQLQHQQQLNDQLHQRATVRKNQARLDRDLFWSIINSPHTIPIHTSRSRSTDVPVSYMSRMSHVPAPELRERSDRPSAPDIQRILAFKRLTRNLGSMRHRSHIAGVIPVTRVNPGVIVPSEANSGVRINRHIPMRRYARTGPVGPLPPVDTYERERGAPGRMNLSHIEGRSPRSSRARAPTSAADESRSQPPQASVLAQALDEANNNPIIPNEEIIVDEEENAEQDVPLEGEIENDATDNSSPPLPLEEEIVAIELDNDEAQGPDTAAEDEPVEPIADAAAPDDGSGTNERFSDDYTPPVDEPMASTSSGVTSANSQPPNQGVKRKRRESEEDVEPYSVKEFNQNLLRLLECPVCLEWMEPPMSQCRRGHLVCGRCRARLASCPVCRTTFSSVRNRAMEGVAEMLRYPCRHGCGREVRLRRRAPHEASCFARKYQCPAPPCADAQPLPRAQLATHFQRRHLTMMKIGSRHKFSMKVNSEQHDNWLILAMEEYFHLRIDVDIRTSGVVVYVSYIGPKCDARNFIYEVTVDGQHNQRKLVYARTTHSDLESSSLNVSRQDCFHLTLDQALNFIRFKNRHCDAEKFLDFNVEISKVDQAAAQRDESDS